MWRKLDNLKFFDIVPVARRTLIDSMSDGVIVLDRQNRVVDINPVGQQIIGRSASEVMGQTVESLMPGGLDLAAHYSDAGEAQVEVTLGVKGDEQTYEMHLSPIQDRRGRIRGRLIVIHDITERKRSEAALLAQKRLYESLMAMARATAKQTSLEATLRAGLNMAAALTGAEYGSIFLLDGTGSVTHSVWVYDKMSPAQRQDAVNRIMADGLAGWVVRHRQPALIRDTSKDQRWLDRPDRPYPVRSALSMPIVSGSAVLGILTLHHSKPNYFDDEHAYLIQSSADQLTLALRNAQMYDEMRRLADRQTLLYETLRTVGEHLDPETIAHAAVEAIAQLTNWPVVNIFLPDDMDTHLVIQASAGELAVTEGWYISVNQGVTGRAFRAAQAQYVPDVDADPDYVCVNTAHRSELAVPMRRSERILGVLDIASDRLDAFDENDIVLAKSVAEAIGLALDNARLYVEIRQYAADLSALYTVGRAVSRSLVMEEVLLETLNSALTSLDFDAGLISLANPKDGQLYLVAERDLPQRMSNRLRKEGLTDSLFAYVHSRGEVLTIGDIEQDTPMVNELKRDRPYLLSRMKEWGVRACSCIPLLHQARSLGTLALVAFQPRIILAVDEILHMAIGRQIATAVTNAELFKGIADERSRLQALIESSRDGIVLIGMDLHVLVVNAPALALLDLPGRPEQWIGRPMEDALAILDRHAPHAAQVIQTEMDRVRIGEDLSRESEFEVPPRTIHLMNLPVVTGAEPLGRLLMLRDVTEERLLESMREDLVHAMVHDLRNPLTAIYGALSFLEDTVADVFSDTERQLWEIARDNTDGMLQLIRAILDISRLESHQMPLDHELISLSGFIAGVLDSLLPLAASKGIHLESDVPSTLPPAWADEGLIERVLQNLIGNALKFTPAAGAVRVTANLDATERRRLYISVSDDGPGISPAIQERLFQKFVTGKHESRGSGLGLAFCRMVMEAHGERIWVEDTSENGTTFTFTLPLPPVMEP
jgi:PAS domain S-box-containing protein